MLIKSRANSPIRAKLPHLTQMRHPIFNPDGLEKSENCGPTSLALCLDKLGKRPRDYREGDGTQALIDAARFAMFSDAKGRSLNPEKDGVHLHSDGSVGDRAEADHQTLSNLEDMERGALNSGASTQRLRDLGEVKDVLEQETPVALAGNPAAVGAHGSRFGLDYDGGHFIVLNSYDENTELYQAHDPLIARAPILLEEKELEAFVGAEIFNDCVGLAFLSK